MTHRQQRLLRFLNRTRKPFFLITMAQAQSEAYQNKEGVQKMFSRCFKEVEDAISEYAQMMDLVEKLYTSMSIGFKSSQVEWRIIVQPDNFIGSQPLPSVRVQTWNGRDKYQSNIHMGVYDPQYQDLLIRDAVRAHKLQWGLGA